MKLHNTEKLFQEFPDLFERANLPYGFECQDGWFALLYRLACQLREYKAQVAGLHGFAIFRVRQHLGELRIHACSGDEVTRRLIRETEDKAKTLCEFDGQPASGLFVCAPHWYRYLCKTCADLHGCMHIEDLHGEDAAANPEHISHSGLGEKVSA